MCRAICGKRAFALAAVAALVLAGCSTHMPSPVLAARNHAVLGVWEYEADGNVHRREFTPDGKCIMYRGRRIFDKDGKRIAYKDNGESVYVGDFAVINSRLVIVTKIDRRKQELPYEVLVDGRLSVEDRHVAKRIR